MNRPPALFGYRASTPGNCDVPLSLCRFWYENGRNINPAVPNTNTFFNCLWLEIFEFPELEKRYSTTKHTATGRGAVDENALNGIVLRDMYIDARKKTIALIVKNKIIPAYRKRNTFEKTQQFRRKLSALLAKRCPDIWYKTSRS